MLSTFESLFSTGFDLFNHKVKERNESGLFNMLMWKVTHAPVNLYFDITPVQRIRRVVF